MNILHVTPSYYPATYWGGPIFSVYGLNNALARIPNVTISILTTDAAGPYLNQRVSLTKSENFFPNQDVIFTRRLVMSSISLGLLFKLPILLSKCDIVHLTGTYSFPTIPTLGFCRLFNKPVVWSPRGAIQDSLEWTGSRRKLLKRLWERICVLLLNPDNSVIHTTADRERYATQKRLSNTHAVVIPNGCDIPPVFANRQWLPNNNLRLIFLGRLSEKKGIDNLIAAVGSLDDSTVSLIVYGAGDRSYESYLKGLVQSYISPNVKIYFGGHLDGQSKYRAFELADICVVPSHSENFCMVVAESLAHGVPVIASTGTPWEEVEKIGCGLWVDNTPAAIADAIVKMRSMPLAEMGGCGKTWIANEFSWDSVARQTMATYEDLIN
jgi:glycosyltransferase involved in cell wall biosynthesis